MVDAGGFAPLLLTPFPGAPAPETYPHLQSPSPPEFGTLKEGM
jgi:hypothetical protein